MPKNLVIVESPAKAKTIEGYLGKDFTVKSSYGHVRDLQKGDKAIDIANNFTPTYEVSPDKKDVVKELKKLAKEAEMVWLATDDDREGEAISWHLKESLDLDDKKTRRIVFREITKNAILNAVQTPRGIDIDLVNAQQARRILDRLVGFEMSPVLWKKIKAGLSAGRVQSVAVRIVVDREREVDQFNATALFKVTAEFKDGTKTIKAELPNRFETEAEAQAFLDKLVGADFFVRDLEKKPAKKSPSAPFTTSTLQQEASRKLSFSVAQTMTVAQRLYEAGKISYMRTDSVNLSDFAIDAARTTITTNYGGEYAFTRKYKSKSENAQEAHEAIRPTDFNVQQASSDRNEQRLYDLIWKRAIASQMADAKLERTVVTIGNNKGPENFIATGEVITFEGFLKVYLESKDEEDEDEEEIEAKTGGTATLPPLTVNQKLGLNQIVAVERYTRPPSRYTEASLVKKLEEMGIGRPSTYAPTISTIQKRGYVIKEDRDGRERKLKQLTLKDNAVKAAVITENTGQEKSKLFPTDLAMITNDFLVEHFPRVTDFNFTAMVEKEFDDIAEGKIKWQSMLKGFYGDFHEQVLKTENIDRSTVNTSRILGTHPETGEQISTRLGRYGPFVQIGEADEEKGIKPKYASLRKGQLIENITLEEALELFKLPRELGAFEDKPMVVAIGRFGPYIRHNSKFVSIPKIDDPMTISAERGIELILAKRVSDAEKLILEFPESEYVKVLKGRWGPYLAIGKNNFKLPKDKEPASLTYAECLAIAGLDHDPTDVDAGLAKAKKGKAAAKKTTTAKKTAVKKAAVKKPAAKKPAAKKAVAKKAAAKKPAAKKASAKKTTAKK
ncbi:type I DNA topoisomerase [Cytophaga hutchinsonii]|uniref:DNA topoisomerase 1 n=1 Tax=Cytophaga hutchinsonii (strain ATCC 33406 / DSM 1761 / CIP 103989 / NBRC 15051 / NCIMB 9469 / D465) TaxID=269798 RepID=A0A6N4ST95_CYTH3|nr:type I DNA topoisomerase [Cytophaga hutchinsonii]ABG59601.1 DNA topoisomerase I [Cytophaga hutchinsonii ATCC 33406]SFX67404.1 DNA topoisomerase I [Cytophaga hutchinsonii ATCC 33406]